MTIDERLEALAQSLELLASMHRDGEKRMEAFQKQAEAFQKQAEAFDERAKALAMHLEILTHVHADFERRMTDYAADVKDSIKRLTNISSAHNDTLDDHEHRIEDLES